MRLSESEIIAGLDYPNIHVRDNLLSYFENQHSTLLELTHAVIATIEKYGWEEAFCWPHKVRLCRHDASSLAWSLDQIDELTRLARPETDRLSTLPSHLVAWVANAPAELLIKAMDRIASQTAFQITRDESAETPLEEIRRRIEIAELDSRQAWERIEGICRSLADTKSFPLEEISLAEDLMEPIIADGDNYRDQLLDILRGSSSDHDAVNEWSVGLMITLAGRLRFADSTPYLLTKFHDDWDWYNEEIASSLSRIGTLEVHQQVVEHYVRNPHFVRSFLISPLEHIHCDGAAENILQLVEAENEDDGDRFCRVQLAIAMTSHFDDFAIEPAIAIYEEDPADPERIAIIERLHAFAGAANMAMPDMEQWRVEIERHWHRMTNLPTPADLMKSMVDMARELDSDFDERPDPSRRRTRIDLVAEPITKQHRTGRNQPCPCGSGKKYKKCCLNVQK